jgi:flagellar hook-basal body complex protein FliE
MGLIPPVGMMQMGQQFTQAVEQFQAAQPMQLQSGVSFQNYLQPQVGNGEAIGSFQNVMANSIQGINQTVRAPEALMKEAMSGGRVDIHDVVIASSKAELAVSLTSQTLTKVIQAYDRISQIQV